jgi:vitamin B12 transporter
MYPKLKPIAAAIALATVASTPVIAADKDLDPIVVTATRQASRASELLSDVTIIEREEIERAGHSSLAELLSRQPGVECTTNGGEGTSTGIHIRGANSNHTLLLIDGLRVNSATFGGNSFGYIPLELIDHIEILRGPASSLYGSDAIGGVIQVFTKKAGDNTNQPFVDVGYGSYNTSKLSTGISGKNESLRYSIGASTTESSGFSSLKRGSYYYNPDKDAFSRNSMAGNFLYDITQGHTVGARIVHSQGIYGADDGPNKNARYEQSVTGLSAFSTNKIAPNWSSTLTLGTGVDDSKKTVGSALDAVFRTNQDQYQWQNDFTFSNGKGFLTLERLDQKVSSNGPNGSDYLLKTRTIDSLATGILSKLGNNTLQLSLRSDHNTQFGDKMTESVAYGYQFSPAWRSSLAYGTAFKAPTFNDLYYPRDAWGMYGNPNLKAETATNKEAALHFEVPGHHTSVVYYENQIKNLINWAPVNPNNPWGDWSAYNVSNANITGLTLAYKGNLTESQSISTSLNLQDPHNADTGKQLNRRSKESANIAFHQKMGVWTWTTEVAAYGDRYDDVANTKKLGGYTLVNLQSTYALDKAWALYARANNVFNREYELARYYGTPGANLFVGIRYTPQ